MLNDVFNVFGIDFLLLNPTKSNIIIYCQYSSNFMHHAAPTLSRDMLISVVKLLPIFAHSPVLRYVLRPIFQFLGVS